MDMKNWFTYLWLLFFIISVQAKNLTLADVPNDSHGSDETFLITSEELRDKIRGGLLGQILGNLNGLPHELKYFDEPGNIENYIPALPEGAWTDDDTDFEWVYIIEMQKQNTFELSPEEITRLWQERINRRIWCSNQYARQLMNIGLQPPLTGNVLLNPWAEFNISGQFLCETFGLLGPGMPQTAAKIGLNYTKVAIDGEPAQATQMFNAMIATAFQTSDLNTILQAGIAAVDSQSKLVEIVTKVQNWHRQNPDDWRETRQQIKENFSQAGGGMRDSNGYELNTAATISAILYGNLDFALTLQHAFNFGWDCDNNAATAGTIIGTIKGYRWMLSQGWQIVDRYKNTTRDNMPQDETITSFADRVIELAEQVITAQGGRKTEIDGKQAYAIKIQAPANVEPLYDTKKLRERMVNKYTDNIADDLQSKDPVKQARGTYMAICFDLVEKLRQKSEKQWLSGIAALQNKKSVLQVLFHHSDVPAAPLLREKMLDAGITPPRKREKLW